MSDMQKKQNFLQGTALLAMATAIVKVIGALYKIPLNAIIGEQGFGYFNTAYDIYNVLLMISTAGLPVAMSRMISQASSLDHYNQVRRIYHTARGIFLALGIAGSLLMTVFCRQLAAFQNQPDAWAAIGCLGPCVLLICVMSTYRGFFQGQGNMLPTSVFVGFKYSVKYHVRRRYHTARTVAEKNGLSALRCKLNVLYHLSHRKFDADERLNVLLNFFERRFRERPKRYRTYHSDFDSPCSRFRDGVFRNACGNAERNDADLRIVGQIFLPHSFVLLYFCVSFKSFEVALFEFFGHEIEGIYDIVLPLHLRSRGRPRLVKLLRFAEFEADGFHHLSHRAVGKDHRRHSVFVRKVKALDREVSHFLNGRGRKHYHAEVAVTARFRRHEIVGLRRLYSAETRTASFDVDDKGRQIRTRDI